MSASNNMSLQGLDGYDKIGGTRADKQQYLVAPDDGNSLQAQLKKGNVWDVAAAASSARAAAYQG